MTLGFAQSEITPQPGITLSGFASRCNQPATRVADPIFVKALLLGEGGEEGLLLSFDLLALGPELHGRLHDVLDQMGPEFPDRAHRVFVCTHTHSAPATITLIGCGIPEPSYWSFLVEKTVTAVKAAGQWRTPVRLRTADVALPGSHYNRHSVMEDGRVVMNQFPIGNIVRRGPTQETMQLLRFETDQGVVRLTLLSWAAHPCILGGLEVSADFPGELCSRLAASWDAPVVFLQGASGDLNLPFVKMNRQEMTAICDKILERCAQPQWSLPDEPKTMSFVRATVPLGYQLPSDRESVQEFHDGMAQIAQTGAGPEASVNTLTNILNVEPGEKPDPVMLRWVADTMRIWSSSLLKTQLTSLPSSIPLECSVWRLGPLVLVCVAAEVFVETALALQQAFPRDRVLVLGYASPLVGYLPTDQCRAEGGYEVEYAYRFYNHPGPFAEGSEGIVRNQLAALIKTSKTGGQG